MKNYNNVANLSEDCIREINKLQSKLTKEAEQGIILVAYKNSEAEN